MPYKTDGSDVPKGVPDEKKKQFAAIWNRVFAQYNDEQKAFKIAYAAIKKFDLDDLEKTIDELEKAGARHSAADLKMFDQVATALKDVAAGITEGVLPLLERLKGVEGMQTEPTSEEKPKPEEKPAEPAEKRDMAPNVVGNPDRSKLADSDFVDSAGRRFPVMGAGDVMDAVHSFGRMGEPKMPFDEFKRKLIALCRRKGFMDALPKSWKEGLKKAENLDERTMMVRRAFDKQFGLDKPNESTSPMEVHTYHPRPFVDEVWDKYAIVCVYTEEYEAIHYKVNYTKPEDSFTFDDPSEWEQVEKVWQVVPTKKNVIVIGKSSDDEKMLTYGVVLKPKPFVDSQDDAMSKEEVEEAAHLWMAESRLYDLLHKDNLDSATVTPVESYIAPQDLTWGDKVVPAGSWVVVSHVRDPKIWQMIKERKINAYSIKGFGHRKEVGYAELAN